MSSTPLTHGALLLTAAFAVTACHHHTKVEGPSLPPGVTVAMVAEGDTLFNHGNCQKCHGLAGIGADGGRHPLNTGKWENITGSYADLVSAVTDGMPTLKRDDGKPVRRMMRPRGNGRNLTDDQIKAVAAYVYTLSHK